MHTSRARQIYQDYKQFCI